MAKQVYTKPDAEIVNLAALARIALIEERTESGMNGNDDFNFDFSIGVDNDQS